MLSLGVAWGRSMEEHSGGGYCWLAFLQKCWWVQSSCGLFSRCLSRKMGTGCLCTCSSLWWCWWLQDQPPAQYVCEWWWVTCGGQWQLVVLMNPLKEGVYGLASSTPMFPSGSWVLALAVRQKAMWPRWESHFLVGPGTCKIMSMPALKSPVVSYLPDAKVQAPYMTTEALRALGLAWVWV